MNFEKVDLFCPKCGKYSVVNEKIEDRENDCACEECGYLFELKELKAPTCIVK